MSILMRVVLCCILHLVLQKKGFLLTCKYTRNSKEKDIIVGICLGFKLSLLVSGNIYQIKIFKNGKKIRCEVCKSLDFLWLQGPVLESTTLNLGICKEGGSFAQHTLCILTFERCQLTTPGITG